MVNGSNLTQCCTQITNCEIPGKDLLSFLEKCPKLRKLDLSDSPSLYAALSTRNENGLSVAESEVGQRGWMSTLSELVIQQSHIFTPQSIDPKVFGYFPKLTTLDLSFWHDASDENVEVFCFFSLLYDH